MTERGEQKRYSDEVPVVLNEKNRMEKAEKILKILQDFVGREALHQLDCLDIGCSGGIIDLYLADHVRTLVGLDIDQKAIQYAKTSRSVADNVWFAVGSALSLPFENDRFDLLICNHVYAHVSDPHAMMQEIHRVLKPGGACYFAAGNKYTLIEGNYRLPFLSWLPPGVANSYLKMFRGIPSYYERHMSVFQLRRLVLDYDIQDYTLKIIQEPDKFGYSYVLSNSVNQILGKIASRLYAVIPTYIWLLVKRKKGR